MAEEAVVGKHDVAEIVAISQPADQHRQLLVEFLDIVVHPWDADVVDLQHGAPRAQSFQLVELRKNENVPDHDLARIGAFFLQYVEHLDPGVSDFVIDRLRVGPQRAAGVPLRTRRGADDTVLVMTDAPSIWPEWCGPRAHRARCHFDDAGAVGREPVVVDHAFGQIAHHHLGDVIDRFAPPVEADPHALGIKPGGGDNVSAAAPADCREKLWMPPDIRRGQVDDGPDAVFGDHYPGGLADLFRDLLQIPHISVVELAALIGIADVLVRQRHSGFARRDITQHGSYCGHLKKLLRAAPEFVPCEHYHSAAPLTGSCDLSDADAAVHLS